MIGQELNPHAPQPAGLLAFGRSLWLNRQLLAQMVRRDVTSRFSGSGLGIGWTVIDPLVLLAIYTVVFSTIFQGRWTSGPGQTTVSFALVLFCGMIPLSFAIEVVGRAPTIIITNANYVKRVVFPLEILPVMVVCTALVQAVISLAILLPAILFVNGSLPWTVIFAPLVLVPLVVLAIGVALLLASIGVFARDLGQVTALFSTILTFLSPVFYPLAAVPESLRGILQLNPLAFIIEQLRDVLIWGRLPFWVGGAVYLIAALAVCALGHAWFQKTRKGFADVL